MRVDIDASHMRASGSPPQLLAPRSVCPAVDVRLERNTEFRPSFIDLTIAAFERSLSRVAVAELGLWDSVLCTVIPQLGQISGIAIQHDAFRARYRVVDRSILPDQTKLRRIMFGMEEKQ